MTLCGAIATIIFTGAMWLLGWRYCLGHITKSVERLSATEKIFSNCIDEGADVPVADHKLMSDIEIVELAQ